jgi:hypothetical protein
MTVKTVKKQFSAGDIAALTGLSVPRIDQLIGLGTLVLSHSEKQAAGSGNKRRMDLPTVLPVWNHCGAYQMARHNQSRRRTLATR